MQANYIQRLRIRFSKFGATCYISHLDLARTLERIFNRAKIPVAYTQGFNRRPRMQFATALPLGYTSEAEVLDVLLQETLLPATVRTQLNTHTSPGIEILSVKEVDTSEPALQAQTVDTKYLITIPQDYGISNLSQKVNGFLASESIMREKESKKRSGRIKRTAYDLRPLVLDLRLQSTTNDNQQLMTHLYLEPAKTGRPDEVVSVLGFDPLTLKIHRTYLGLASEK